jgi:hypothetical protein
MTKILWQDQPLDLAVHQQDDADWLSLAALTDALDGHLQDLPGEAVGFCLADDRCLPLRGDDLRTEGPDRWVRVSALAPLGITAEGAPPFKQILLGDPMPDITFTTLSGEAIALRSLIGKPTMLFAWASW